MLFDSLALVLVLLCTVHSSLNAPLILHTEPQSARVASGGRVVLECGVMNDGLNVRLSWQHSRLMPSSVVITTPHTFSNVYTSTNSTNSRIEFESVEPQNAGYYQCLVTADDSKVYSRIAHVEVHYLSMSGSADSKVKEVRDVYSSFVVELGDCNADRIQSYPTVIFTWNSDSSDDVTSNENNMVTVPEDGSIKDVTGGGVFMTRSVSKDSLLIYNIRSSQGTRTYRCYAEVTSDLIKERVEVVSWTIQGTEKYNFDATDERYNYMTNTIVTSNPSVNVGENLTMGCATAGHTTEEILRYTWYSPGGAKISNSSRVRVSNVTSGDGGKYVCEARLGERVEHGVSWVSVNELELAEVPYYTVVPQELWYVVVYFPTGRTIKKKLASIDTTDEERVDVSQNVTKRSVDELWDHNTLYVKEVGKTLRKRGVSNAGTINPICLSNNSRVAWLYNGEVVTVPLQLPALPQTFLTYQCTTRNTLYWDQRSIAVYIDSAQIVTLPDMVIVEELSDTFIVRCNSSGFPPPDLELMVTVYPPVKDHQVLNSTITQTQYDSVLLSVVKKSAVMEVTCVSSNPYYKESTSASYEFTTEPVEKEEEEEEEKEDIDQEDTGDQKEEDEKEESGNGAKEEDEKEEENETEEEDIDTFEHIEEVKEDYIQTPMGEFPVKIALSAVIGGSVILILVITFFSCFIVYKKRQRRAKEMMISEFKRSIHLQIPSSPEALITQGGDETSPTYNVPRGSEAPLIQRNAEYVQTVQSMPVQKPSRAHSQHSLRSIRSCKSVHPEDELDAYEHRRSNGVRDEFMKAQYDINKKVKTENTLGAAAADIQKSGLMDPITKTLYCLPPAIRGDPMLSVPPGYLNTFSLPRDSTHFLKKNGDLKENLLEKKSVGKKEVFADLEETLNQLRLFSETSFSESDMLIERTPDGGLVKPVRGDGLNPFGYSCEDIEMVDFEMLTN